MRKCIVLVIFCSLLLMLCQELVSQTTPQAGYSWVPSSNGAGIPGAVLAGTDGGDRDGDKRLFVCRARIHDPSNNHDALVPGKVVVNACNVAWGGQERVIHNYEVLVQTDAKACWGPKGASGALVAGHESDGVGLVLCRGEVITYDTIFNVENDRGTHPGKVLGRYCWVGYGGGEYSMDNYQVYYPQCGITTPPQPGSASCNIPPTPYSCDLNGLVVSGTDPGCGVSCVRGYTPSCTPGQCFVGDRYTLSFCYCAQGGVNDHRLDLELRPPPPKERLSRKPFSPDFSMLPQFTLVPWQMHGHAANIATSQGCLWADSDGNPVTEPVGTTECVAGTTFVCRIDGAWANTFQSCQAEEKAKQNP